MESNDKKLKILVIAEALIADQGFSETSVREIAKAADVNVAMISYYFGSKEKLLVEIFKYRSDYLKTRVDELLCDETISNWIKLDTIIDHYVEKFKVNQDLHRIILQEINRHCNAQLSAFILERKKTHYNLICQFIRQGQENGDFSKDVDVLWLYSLLPGITKQMMLSQDFFSEIIEEQQGKKPTSDDLIQLTKEYLRKFFRKILEIK